MKILLTIFVLFFSSSALSFVHWGITTNCEIFSEAVKNGDAQIAIRSYLTGLNHSLIELDRGDETRNLNFNSSSFAESYVEEQCRKNKDQKVYHILYDYFLSLPYQ